MGEAIIAVDCTNIVVRDCTSRHLRGPGGNFVQFDKVAGGEVSDCTSHCDPSVDDPEDHISVYKSTDVHVLRNLVDGGGPSNSGSGIMLGDQGGSGHVCADNVLINPGQVGIGVAGGTNISVLRNRIYNEGLLGSNVGLFVHNYGPDSPMSGIEVRDNRVDWTDGSGVLNPRWLGDDTGTVAGWDDNEWFATLDPDVLRAE